MTAYLLLILGAFMCSVQFVFTKKYEGVSGQSLRASMLFSLFVSLFAGALMLVMTGFQPQFTVFSAVFGILMGLDVIIINVVGMKAMHLGKLSVYTLFMMLGGMLVPFFMGVAVLGEKPSVCCIIATLLVIASLVLPSLEKTEDSAKNSKLFFVLCLALFFLNGGYSCLSKLHQINAKAVDTYSLLFAMYAVELVVSGIVLLATAKSNITVKVSGKSVLFSLGFALFSSVGAMIIVSSAVKVDASVLYPIVTGGTVIFSAVCGRVLFKEKINKTVALEILLAVAATVLFMF